MLNDDILKYTLDFVDCDCKLYLVNKFFYDNFKCRIVKYKNLRTCLVHKNDDIYKVIMELRRHKIGKDIRSIHFENSNQLKIAKPYISLFGDISHYCCSSTGVMFNCKICKINKLRNICTCLIMPPMIENKK